MKLWNPEGEQNLISDALQLKIPKRSVICLTGSGGKTSLLFAWARELTSAGRRTVITTTTHMQDPAGMADDVAVIYTDAENVLPVLYRALDEGRIAAVVSRDPENPRKVIPPPPDVMAEVNDIADIVLIEADGSRRMPLKWPAPWEPVVPASTDITVCIAGLSALGKPLTEVMYRSEHLPKELRRDIADEDLVSCVLSSPLGGRKSATGEFRVLLNQADYDILCTSAARIAAALAGKGIKSAWGKLRE